jgi:ABC-type sugar transport system substrate-binding protein
MKFQMSKSRTLVVATVALVLVTALIGRAAFFDESEKPIVFVHEQQGNSWYALHSLGFWDACEDFDVYCKEYSDDSYNISGKLDLCERMLADGGTAGLMATVHDSSYDACLDQFDEPFANIHGMYNETDNFLTRITPDIEGYSEAAAHAMADAIGGEGEVIVTQNGFSTFENLVAETFCDVIESDYDITCTESVEAGKFPDNVLVATALLAQYPEATGAFNTSSFGPLMWMNALRDAGYSRGDIVVIAMDAVEENLDAIRDGWVYAVVAQPGYEENYEAVRAIVDHNNGELVEADQLLPAPVVTKAEIGEYYEMVERVKEFLNR